MLICSKRPAFARGSASGQAATSMSSLMVPVPFAARVTAAFGDETRSERDYSSINIDVNDN